MTTSTIIFIIGASLAAISFFLGRKFGTPKKSDDSLVTNTDNTESDIETEQKVQIDELKKQVEDLASQLKQKDEMLNSALSGNVSDITDFLQKEIRTLKEKIGTLTKNIEEVEDERDDFEDDAKSANNKLKKKSEELAKISSEMSELTRKMEALQIEFNTQSAELEDEKQQNKERKESIDFVNAILNAKEASDEFTKARNEAIENVSNTLKNYYDSLVYWDLGEEKRKNYPNLASKWANEQKKPWIKGEKIIALIGEFSAGKTSIVNRILSQDDQGAPKLPTNSKATTAIPTYISYRSEFTSQFLDSSGKLKNIKKEDFESVNKDILNKVNVSSLLDYFVMSYNNINLKGITILDTPGFSSNDPEDERRTCEVINEADVLFWVFDVNQAINKSSITIIKNNLKKVPLFVVMNKCDQLSPNEQNDKEDNLKKILQKENISINGIIRFSEKEPINVLMKAANSVNCKKEDDAITRILEDMFNLYNDIDKKYKECQKLVTNKKRNLRNAEDKIETFLDQYQEDAKVVGDLPTHNTHFFSKDCYEISEYEYDDFKERCDRMLDNRDPFEKQISNLKELSEIVVNCEKKFSELKQQRNMLQDFEKKIVDAIQKFDKKYSIPVHVNYSRNNND